MGDGKQNLTARIALVGGTVVVAILVIGTLLTGQLARRDTLDAVRSVSALYLDELAGRREQVVEDNLKSNVNVIDIAIGLMSEEDLSDEEHLRAYQAQMKTLFDLERFAFVSADGLVYTSEGTETDAGQYQFDYATLAEPEIFVKDPESAEKKVVIAVPLEGITFQGTDLVACFMQIDMDVMLKGVSMTSQDSEATFCNIYTKDGIALSDTVLGGLAVEDNLLEALSHADFEEGSSYLQVVRDFEEGRQGTASFAYDGIQETLSYVPVEGTDWLLTYLVRESVISERIGSVTEGTIRRCLTQSLLTALVLITMFAFILAQMRKNAQLALEKETSETASRIKHEEMEQRLALQGQLLAQKAEREQSERMITALASDYRSVYYLELDSDFGTCYQARNDLDGFSVGDEFPYLASVTAYCNRYVLEAYREEFLRFVQPDAIRAGLKESSVISYTYMICVDGVESYEAVRFAGVRRPGSREGREGGEGREGEGGEGHVHGVGACFVDVDTETRKALSQQQALSEALAAAEQASRAKTVFLSNMSHEIRTPMNAIIGLNNIAQNEPDLPEKVQEYLLKMGAAAQHLLGIINDILDMSRIESGRMVVKNEEFSFAKSLEQVNTIIGGQCADKGLHYECRTIGRIDDRYVGDGMKLKQVIINILGNAVKFTPAGGTVTFLIEEGPRFDGKATLKLTIADTGIGMSEEYLPHLFDAFSQEDASSTSRFGSTGLGMPITKSIVELMCGHIDVESEKGVGTTFRVTVTLGESDRRGDDALEGALDPSQLDVLAIDDDPIALEHAQIVLRQTGINCEAARSGEEGIEMVRMRHARGDDYDLLLVDWKMPGMDGVETTRQIRRAVGDELPIIILTSYNWDDIAEEARGAGVDTFVSKPLFAGSVLDEFHGAFREKSRAMEERAADLAGRRMLLAEDMMVNAEIMKMMLGMRQIEVDLAENGRVATEMFAGHPAGHYDAILMDIRMPEMDGLEATKVIRSSGHADATDIPIIALTANAFDEDVQRSLQAGMSAHLSKPVEADILFETLERLIRP